MSKPNAVYDRLVNAPRKETAGLTIGLLDRLQLSVNHGVQVAACAALFLTVCERFGVPAQDAFTASKNLMNDHDGRSHEFRGVQAYAENEL